MRGEINRNKTQNYYFHKKTSLFIRKAIKSIDNFRRFRFWVKSKMCCLFSLRISLILFSHHTFFIFFTLNCNILFHLFGYFKISCCVCIRDETLVVQLFRLWEMFRLFLKKILANYLIEINAYDSHWFLNRFAHRLGEQIYIFQPLFGFFIHISSFGFNYVSSW